jgi:hypothetical protein
MTIIGVDGSPIQSPWVRRNIESEIDDVTNIWLHPDGSFDFVHIRQMAGIIPTGRTHSKKHSESSNQVVVSKSQMFAWNSNARMVVTLPL